LTHEPAPLTPELARQFRGKQQRTVSLKLRQSLGDKLYERDRLGLSKLDERIAWLHNEVGKGATGDMLRKVFGAGPASGQVQYVTKKQGAVPVSTDGSEEGQGADGDEDEDDGLSAKFRRSALPTRFDRRLVTFLSFLQFLVCVLYSTTQVQLVYMRYDCF
jgi:hypothetical protein